MWLSRSFTFCLAAHLILATILGIVALPFLLTLIAESPSKILGWPPLYFYVLGALLWDHHYRIRERTPESVDSHLVLWFESALFMIFSIGYYPIGIRASITLPGLEAPDYWALFFFPLIIPIYLLCLSIAGLCIAMKRRRTPSGG